MPIGARDDIRWWDRGEQQRGGRVPLFPPLLAPCLLSSREGFSLILVLVVLPFLWICTCTEYDIMPVIPVYAWVTCMTLELNVDHRPIKIHNLAAAAHSYIYDIPSIQDNYPDLPAVFGSINLNCRIQAGSSVTCDNILHAQAVAKALRGLKGENETTRQLCFLCFFWIFIRSGKWATDYRCSCEKCWIMSISHSSCLHTFPLWINTSHICLMRTPRCCCTICSCQHCTRSS